MFGPAKKRQIGSDPHKKEDVKLEISIRLTTNDRYDSKKIAEIENNKVLISNSDSKIKDLREEIDKVLGEVYQDLSDRIEINPLLTDGHWAEKEKINE